LIVPSAISTAAMLGFAGLLLERSRARHSVVLSTANPHSMPPSTPPSPTWVFQM
jgi:hypothetical protein